MTSQDRLRVGIVGTGAVAQLVHLPFCTNRRDVEVVAVADKDPDKAEALARRFHVPGVLSTEELLQGDAVDAVILCTPNHLHESEAVTALGTGKHVLVERPLALTPGGCRAVVEAAESSGRILVVGMSHRFRPDVAALRAFVAGGELGEVYAGRVAWMNRFVPMRRTTWRQNPEEAGGGALMDLGAPALDLLLWVLGNPTVQRVSAILSDGEPEVEHAANVLMETDGGLSLSLEVSWTYFAREDTHYLRVLGREGSGQLPPLEIFKQLGGRPMDVTPEQGGPPRKGGRYLNAHRRQLDHFFRAARGFAEVELPRSQAQVMAILQAAYESAREGREVEL
ncbi:MAG: Gfo/Idh/MocA family oxidoreductase [Gemmatimonadales bacterium]|jgi:predicted dehydrogenase|nr:MAG: Gfo/Idh/MocA family oxidoreductase [Gemmatimonadales bacterium]